MEVRGGAQGALVHRRVPRWVRKEDVKVNAFRAPQAGTRVGVGLAALLCCLVAAPSARAAGAFSATPGYAKVAPVCPVPQPGEATCFALVRVPVSSSAAARAGAMPFTVNDGASESGPAGGLTPAQLASAYGYSPTAGGAGQTIAIVDAYDDPSIEADLAAFDTEYGIAACTTANGCFTKISQTGSTVSLPEKDTTGWSVEISLDVEAAHSTCPQCKILLVEAKSATFKNLATAVEEAVSKGATEVSNSYGGPEGGLGSVEKAAYQDPGVVVAAATGDNGYNDWTYLNEGEEPPGRPNMPASLPSVVAVGGTTLELDKEGKRKSETVWNGDGPFDESFTVYGLAEGATGGGCSTLFTAQPWQQSAPGFAATGCGHERLAADVSAVADPYTGFDIYDSYNCGNSCEEFKRGKNWLTIGGTSLSTPLISALYALAGGSNGVSYPALTVYGHIGDSSVYDVTAGGNGICDDEGFACGANKVFHVTVDCEGTTACNAAPGYDGPSGVGTPNGLGLFEPLLPAAAIAPPGLAIVGVAASFSGAGSSDPYPGGSISGYSWSWGDGSPESTGVAPAHTYHVPGDFTVTLTVTDNYGLTSAPVTETVEVSERTLKEIEEEEEAAAKKKEEEEAAAKKKAEEEAAAKKKAEEEAAAAKKRAEEEAAAKKKAEEEVAAKKSGEEEAAARRKGEEEAAAARRKAEEEAAAKSGASTGAQEVSGFQAGIALAVPDAELAYTALHVSPSGIVKLRVSCSIGESICSGTATLRTLGAVDAVRGRASKRKPTALTLAEGPFKVFGGGVRTVTLRLSAKARALLARVHSLRARATLLAHDPQGTSHTTRTLVTLRLAKPRRRKG
jgi:PKD domain/Subtilase family